MEDTVSSWEWDVPTPSSSVSDPHYSIMHAYPKHCSQVTQNKVLSATKYGFASFHASVLTNFSAIPLCAYFNLKQTRCWYLKNYATPLRTVLRSRSQKKQAAQAPAQSLQLCIVIITIFIKKIKKNSDEIDVTKEGCNVKGNIFWKFCIFSCWTKGRIPVLSWIRRLTGAGSKLERLHNTQMCKHRPQCTGL